jgi:membrane protease YdiL (CAAX protease family)
MSEPIPDIAKSDPFRRKRTRWGQVFRLSGKELKETLRDRRTIVTLIVMPLIVYPILSLVFRTFLFSNLGNAGQSEEIKYQIAVKTELSQDDLTMFLQELSDLVKISEGRPRTEQPTESKSPDSGQKKADSNNEKELPASSPAKQPAGPPKEAPLSEHHWNVVDDPEISLESLVREQHTDVAIDLKVTRSEQMQRSDIEIYFDSESPTSRRAARFLQENFERVNRVILQSTLRRLGRDGRVAIRMTEKEITAGPRKRGSNFTALIPLVLVLMTITGAVYPAIDLTAGERERGTLETLIAAPIPRMRILVAKLIAVLVVSVLTASLNVIGMLTTIWTFQLEKFLVGDSGLTLMMMVKIFGLLVLFAAFFSALLLVVTSFARSFKEAQAYLIPVIMMSMAPGLLAMTPGLELSPPLAVCPMVNILLLARDILDSNVSLIPAAVAVFSTLIYGVLAIGLAASIFGTDSVLYGSGASWKEMLVRPMERRERASPNVALACLLLLFPINFVMIGWLGRQLESAIEQRLMYTAAFTMFAFAVIPFIIAVHQRVRPVTGFGLGPTKLLFLVGAALLGIGLWPLVMSMIEGWHVVVKLVMGEEASSQWHEQIVKLSKDQAALFRQASPWLIGIAFSITPAFCEEFFFRGLLQRSLLTKRGPVFAIVVSSLAFGIFHTLSGSVAAFDRLIPTTVMGLLLGYLTYKSNSIWPGVTLHAIHNAIVGFLAYYQPQLSELSWFPGEADPIPKTWIAAAAVVSAVGFAIVVATKTTKAQVVH